MEAGLVNIERLESIVIKYFPDEISMKIEIF